MLNGDGFYQWHMAKKVGHYNTERVGEDKGS